MCGKVEFNYYLALQFVKFQMKIVNHENDKMFKNFKI